MSNDPFNPAPVPVQPRRAPLKVEITSMSPGLIRQLQKEDRRWELFKAKYTNVVTILTAHDPQNAVDASEYESVMLLVKSINKIIAEVDNEEPG